MRIDILTLFPEIFDSLNSFSIIDKAIKSKKVNIISIADLFASSIEAVLKNESISKHYLR